MNALNLPPSDGKGCIEFSGGKRKSGYGYAQFQGRQFLAHRLAFSLNEMKHPDAFKGVVIRHKCDNPSCINVEHLEPGTTQDNMNDKLARGRHLRGESAGGCKLTEWQVNEIRSAYVPYSKHANQYVLANKYGVSQSEISQIIAGKRWAQL
jgi:hypothetical protein